VGELAHPLEIRAHHLLCLLGFRGLGYSQEFIATMGKVVKELRSDSTFPITVIAECDVICESCPHNKEGKCRKRADSEWQVKARDLEVLQGLGFESGTQIAVSQAWARIEERLPIRDIARICRDCEWLELGHCAEGLERLKIPKLGQLDGGEGI
jgi:hypothetical protein